jgi:hypothetical protein
MAASCGHLRNAGTMGVMLRSVFAGRARFRDRKQSRNYYDTSTAPVASLPYRPVE